MKGKELYSIRNSDYVPVMAKVMRYGMIYFLYGLSFYILIHLIVSFQIDKALIILFVIGVEAPFFHIGLIGKKCIITPQEVRIRRGLSLFKWKKFPIKDVKSISLILDVRFFYNNRGGLYSLLIEDYTNPLIFNKNTVDKRQIRSSSEGDWYLGGIERVSSYDLRDMLKVLKSLFSSESWHKVCSFKRTIRDMNKNPELWDIVRKYQKGEKLEPEEKKFVETLEIYFGDIETLLAEREKPGHFDRTKK